MARSAVLSASLIAAVLLLQPAAAQTIYKSTLPDGRVLYGDKPAPGAAKVEEVKPDTSKGALGGTTAGERDALKDMEKARQQREAGAAEVQAAEQKLKNAEAALAAGEEPLPSERIGTAGGASRLNEAYFERQRELKDAVEQARREYDQARRRK
jgi:hypothetical protein